METSFQANNWLHIDSKAILRNILLEKLHVAVLTAKFNFYSLKCNLSLVINLSP